VTVVAIVIFVYGLYRSYKRWFPEGGWPSFDHLTTRIKNLIVYGILQRKVIYKGFEGTMHLLIYIGFIILFIGTIIRAFEADITLKLMNIRILTGSPYLFFKLAMNIGGILAIIGIIIAFIRRFLFKSKYLPDTAIDYLILLDLLVIVITGFILDGISTIKYRYDWIGYWDPIGYWIASSLTWNDTLIAVYRVTWLTHMLLAVFSVALIPYTKLFHIIAGGIFNTFFSRLDHPSAFKHIPNIDEIVEKGGIPGSNQLKGFTWKQRMDYDACIKCARCTDNCPATLSEKPLSPMDLIITLRGIMDKGEYEAKLVPDLIEPDIIWSCVTCGSCVYQCPMLIHHVETITDIRRALLGEGENVPSELMQVSYNLMRYGNPLAYNPMERENFIRELIEETGVEIAEPGKEYDYIYWLGCNTSYDPNARPVAKALLKILSKAGLKVAILAEESCCGEPARRIGDELMFKELVKMNEEALKKYKFKKLLVNCPHGYNIFKHEYPLYGVNIKVIHHSQLLNELIVEGKIKPKKKVDLGRVTYHDPCYLGRWNSIYNEPRKVLGSALKNALIEMSRSKEKSLCCGAGGGHLFFELKRGIRIGKLRVEDIKAVNADIVAVACPFCNIMIKSEVPEEIKVLDIAEILVDALEE